VVGLAARARRGDGAALVRLRDELEAALARVVRGALRPGRGRSPLAVSIRAVAARVAADGGPAPAGDREGLVQEVARRVCGSVLGGLAPGRARPGDETVRG
jgi:hypothetical protein